MSFSNSNPDIQLADVPYSAESIPSTTRLHQQKGDFATNGMQPSFALELDISTIAHVCFPIIYTKLRHIYMSIFFLICVLILIFLFFLLYRDGMAICLTVLVP